MICLAVFEKDDNKRKQIKEFIVRYTIQRNCELDVMWFYSGNYNDAIGRYAHKIHIALISLDDSEGESAANALYKYNNDSLIVFYKATLCELEPLLASRPIGFHLWEYGEEALSDKLDAIISEIKESNKIFTYQTKRTMYIYHKSRIAYFQSDLKYVIIHLCGQKETERIYAKLNDIENKLDIGFLRIHKSYIVNTSYIEKLDKKNHMLYLTGDGGLPVSDAQYKKVVDFIDRKSKTTQ